MKIERVWAMPNRWTFQIKPIKQLLDEEMTGLIWLDPFSGKSELNTLKNDIDPQQKADEHMDALQWLSRFEYEEIDGVLFDPPYSPRQISESYKHNGYKVDNETTQIKWYSDRKQLAADIIKPGGKAICFGWNSNGFGKKRGFELERILLVAHGSAHNDTIVTVERKIKQNL